MITEAGPRRQPTKQRLLEAAMRLFAEKGFRETTVGEIEAAVGLEPRRGALYRHFPSKEALLEEALAQHLATLADAGTYPDESPVGDVRSEALAVGRWLLAELDRERVIVRILEQDGERLVELRDSFRDQLVDAGYVVATALARRWLGDQSAPGDIEALSAVLLGALVNYRRSTWTFGAPPLDLDEERFLSAWASLCSLAAGPRTRARRSATVRSRP
ncbi:MAG: TetR/AcrR family transcriptional regulator [Acidimicrobiia bacterium]|nr:TetR/AcrR family transcriptional regulator [Acidimicrobiia bacterium]